MEGTFCFQQSYAVYIYGVERIQGFLSLMILCCVGFALCSHFVVGVMLSGIHLVFKSPDISERHDTESFTSIDMKILKQSRQMHGLCNLTVYK